MPGGGCGSGGIYGFMATPPPTPNVELVRIAPQSTEDWIIVVDSSTRGKYGAGQGRGRFTLEIGWQ